MNALNMSVTQRAGAVSQPHGGYLPLKGFEIERYDDGNVLEAENVSPGTIGTVVDYLTRMRFGASVDEAFSTSIEGAKRAIKLGRIGSGKECRGLINQIAALDADTTIVSACKLAGCYDAFFRAGKITSIDRIEPDAQTIQNIRIMLRRSERFIETVGGEVLLSGFTFDGGYTDLVSSGDGDFLLATGLFDFKTSKHAPTSKHTLQLLMYYIMGLRSSHSEFTSVQRLGF